MADSVPDDELDRLVAGHLDETLDDADAERLGARLRTDADARRLLLAAATQASALPRLGLEALTRVPRPMAQRPTRWWWTAVAAAMVLLASGWWLSPMPVAVRGPGLRVVAERDGRPVPPPIANVWSSGTSPLVLRWLDEDTRIELAASSRLRVEELGVHKRLVLEAGGLRASVAPQPADGGMQIATPHGRIDVVGTSFTVEVWDQQSNIVVQHGQVLVAAEGSSTRIPLSAGYQVSMTPRGVSPPGPVAEMPGLPVTSPPGELKITRFLAVDFAGGEGELVDGWMRAVPVDHVRRLTTPVRRPRGYAFLGDRFSLKLRLTVDRPTTLAVLLVCDQPGGSGWIGNLQAERNLPAGTQEVTFARTDLRPVTGTVVPKGGEVVAIAVMSWGPPADLRLDWIDLTR